MSQTASPRSAACTIISPNYLAFARTLSASYLAQHPHHAFFVLIVADHREPALFADPAAGDRFTPICLHHIGLPDVRALAMMYDILELNTNVKPTFLKHLIEVHRIERLVYLDPDIFVYTPLDPVFEALESADAVLTPHLTAPEFESIGPGEQDILYNGTYNLGFFAVRSSPQGRLILDWWERRCLELGFSEGRSGLFVDQKWINLLPGLFPNVATLRHPGCNMAYWNLYERTLTGTCERYVVNQHHDLCFFHFSGIVIDDPTILSKNTDRFTLANRPDLHRLFAEYKATVAAQRDTNREAVAYGFDTFSDGRAVTRLARRIFAAHRDRWAGHDPFDAARPFASAARRLRLIGGTAPPPRATWREFSGEDRRVRMVHRALKAALSLLGPNRYELLMRYLAHIAILRNQSIFLGGGPPRAKGTWKP